MITPGNPASFLINPWFYYFFHSPRNSMHPAPSTSTQFISVSIQLSAAPSTIFEPKYCTYLDNFPKFRPKNQWCTQELKDVDSESKLRFLKFRPQNPFLGKFGPKKSKVSILSENWYTWYLKDADSYFNISFLNFKSWFPFWANLGQKSQSCSF